MKNLERFETNMITGGMGWYPGYNSDDHIRAGQILLGTTAGFVCGIVEGFWDSALSFME
jgi:hypothetical protein